MAGRVLRGLLGTAVLWAFLFGVAGRTDLPLLWAYAAVVAVLVQVAVLTIDPVVTRDRLRRQGGPGQDPRRLLAIRLSILTLHVLALLDVGRLHWSDTVPVSVRIAALAIVAAAARFTLWAITHNRYFMPVIRIQPERGHQVVSGGPYEYVRHPGYAGMVLLPPASALALGSWIAFGIALVPALLFVVRTAHEDRFLQDNLDGYRDYAARVRWRLLPGAW